MSKRILVIDDEDAVRKSFGLALKGTDYAVDTAENGAEGVDMFEQNPYDLVFLDLKMPVMNGAQTLVEIRKRNETIPIYIVTAFHREFFEQLAEARKQELAFELLMKPIGRDQIRSITKGILEGAEVVEGGGDV